MKITGALRRFYFKEIHPLDLAVARILFFALILVHYWDYQSPSAWFSPGWPLHWQPVSFFSLIPVSWLGPNIGDFAYPMFRFGSLFALFGLGTRIAIPVAFVGALIEFGLPLNFGKVHHSAHFIVITLFFLCFTRDHILTLDRLLWGRSISRGRVTSWPLQALVLYMCFAYFEAGLQKILGGGWNWLSADNFAMIVLTRSSVTQLGVWVAENRVLSVILGKLGWGLEFFAPLALLGPRTKLIFGLGLASFHVGTLILMGSHGAFVQYTYCFAFWVPWSKLFLPLYSRAFGVDGVSDAARA